MRVRGFLISLCLGISTLLFCSSILEAQPMQNQPVQPQRVLTEREVMEQKLLGDFVLRKMAEGAAEGANEQNLGESVEQRKEIIHKALDQREDAVQRIRETLEQGKDPSALIDEMAGVPAASRERDRQRNGKPENAASQHGLKDTDVQGIGQFVQDQLGQGLRGENLSQAIQQELQSRQSLRRNERDDRPGKGRPEHAGRPEGGRGRGKGGPGGQGSGRPSGVGKR